MILDGISLEGLRVAQVKREMSNWLKIADLIYKTNDEQDLLIMMRLEIDSKNRPYVITRLHSRFNALRLKREKEELKAWRKNLKEAASKVLEEPLEVQPE